MPLQTEVCAVGLISDGFLKLDLPKKLGFFFFFGKLATTAAILKSQVSSKKFPYYQSIMYITADVNIAIWKSLFLEIRRFRNHRFWFLITRNQN